MSSSRPVRLAIIVICLGLYAGGALQAWKALRTERVFYPREALDRLAALADDSRRPTASQCASTLDVNLAVIVPPPIQGEADTETDTFTAATQAAVSATAQALRDLTPLFQIIPTATQIFHENPLYVPSTCSEGEEEGCSPGHHLEMATQRGWEAFSLLPSSSRDGWTVLMLLHSNEDNSRNTGDSSGETVPPVSSLVLSERVLMVSVARSMPPHTLAAAMALEIKSWLLENPNQKDVDAISWLYSSCMSGASHEVGKFLKQVDIFTEVQITPAVAMASEAAVSAYQLAVEKGAAHGGAIHSETALEYSRKAWVTAHALAQHSDLGIKPQLPTEHALALLLPIGLPIGLAIVQALGREVSSARKERKKKDD